MCLCALTKIRIIYFPSFLLLLLFKQTTNFVHRIPWFGISIGFAVGKKILMGVVYNPILDE
jgi:hypothetical protein